MKIRRKKSFEKAFFKLPVFIQHKVNERMTLFIVDPFHELLSNHALVGKYEGYRSINITGDFRAIFIEMSDGAYEFVEFIDVWTHSQLYR